MATIAESVLKYINITSIAYLYCLLRFLLGLVLLVPELVGCMGWIGSVWSWVGSSWIKRIGPMNIHVSRLHQRELIHCNPLTQKGASYAYQQKWSFPLQLSGTETTLVSHKMSHSGSGCSIAASPVLTATRVRVSAASLCLTVHELT